jgi:uncharacterized RDD family membrane protein YckC
VRGESTMTEAAWYYAIDGRQRGPVDETTLRSLAAQGVLRREDLVWTDGMVDWAAAGTMPWLFAGAPPAAPTPGPPQGFVPQWPPSAQSTAARPEPWSAGASPASPYAQQPAPPSPYTAHPAPAGPVVPLAYYAPGHAINYAGFWIRFVAWIIDFVVMLIGFALVGGCLGGCLGILATDSFTPRRGRVMGELFGRFGGMIVAWLYDALMTSSSTQATLGKMAVGIKVVGDGGAPISFGRATGRHFAKIISGLLLCFGFIMAAFTERKQALHDIIARTYVIYGRGN